MLVAGCPGWDNLCSIARRKSVRRLYAGNLCFVTAIALLRSMPWGLGHRGSTKNASRATPGSPPRASWWGPDQDAPWCQGRRHQARCRLHGSRRSTDGTFEDRDGRPAALGVADHHLAVSLLHGQPLSPSAVLSFFAVGQIGGHRAGPEPHGRSGILVRGRLVFRGFTQGVSTVPAGRLAEGGVGRREHGERALAFQGPRPDRRPSPLRRGWCGPWS